MIPLTTNRTTKWSGAFLLAALSACASACARPIQIAAPATVTVRSATSNRAVAPMTIAHSNEWLVWSRAKNPVQPKEGPFVNEQTAVIDSQGHVVGQSNGISIALNGETWRWETESRSVDLEPCSPDDGMDTSVQSASMVRVDGPHAGKQARLLFKDYFEQEHGTNDGERPLTMGAVTQSFSPSASVGPYLFVREHTWMFSCGAHGFWGATPHVVDLRTGQEAKLSFPDAETTDAKTNAVDAFVAQYITDNTSGYSPLQESPAADGVRFIATEPKYESGKMGFVNIYLAGVSYADGASDWSSYAIDADVPTITLDHAIAEQSVAPSSVVAYAAQHPDRVIGGWSAR